MMWSICRAVHFQVLGRSTVPTSTTPIVTHPFVVIVTQLEEVVGTSGELNIQAPDPALLVASLDKFAVVLAKTSVEVAFRLQVARAAHATPSEENGGGGTDKEGSVMPVCKCVAAALFSLPAPQAGRS